MRAMPDRQLDQPGVEQTRKLARARDRNWVERAVDDTGCGKRDAGCELTELRPQIVLTQALPHGILRASRHSKWREFAGIVEVAKIRSHRKLEGATLVCGWIPLPQTASAQRVPFALDLGSGHAAGEFRLELAAVRDGDRGGRHEREAFDVRRVLEQVEHGEQPAPGIAADGQPFDSEDRAQGVEVGYMLAPADRRVTGHG